MCFSVMTLKNGDGLRLQEGRMWLWMTRREDDDDDGHAEDEGACASRFLYDSLLFFQVFLKCVLKNNIWLGKQRFWENVG